MVGNLRRDWTVFFATHLHVFVEGSYPQLHLIRCEADVPQRLGDVHQKCDGLAVDAVLTLLTLRKEVWRGKVWRCSRGCRCIGHSWSQTRVRQ